MLLCKRKSEVALTLLAVCMAHKHTQGSLMLRSLLHLSQYFKIGQKISKRDLTLLGKPLISN